MSARKSERGAMDLGSIVQVLILAALVFAAWNLTPVYLKEFQLGDEAQAAAQAYPRNAEGDEACKERIWHKVVELGLDEYLAKGDLEVGLSGTNRIVTYFYQRDVTILPGWTRTFTFDEEIRQPLL